MKDKTVLITGANSGVGFATATALAKFGAAVIMVCRSKERGEVAQRDVARVAEPNAHKA
jgi:NAD(P)-dependent dehydrogenase (short-subunit alcohol dehydrogenase family)